MRRNIQIIFLTFILTIFLTSCGGNNNTDSTKKNIDEFAQFIGGPHGLIITVLDGAPPAIIFDQGSFPFAIVLAIEDVGEANVGPDSINPYFLARVTGVVPESFGTTQKDLMKRMTDWTLHGARKNYDGTITPGEIATMSFEPLNYQYPVFESELFRIQVDICYDYSTHSTLKVCVKDDVTENLQDSTVCNLREELLPRNSGAPIHVIKADQNPAGLDKIQVNFEIQNVNEGVFFNRNVDDEGKACDFSLSNPDIYKALVVVHPVDKQNYDLECRRFNNEQEGFEKIVIPDGAKYDVFKFNNNAPKPFTCFLKKKSGISGRIFQDMLNIDIYYRYGEFIDIPILVQPYN